METIPLTTISPWLIAKIFVVFGLILYLIFAIVMVKQVQLMSKTLEVGLEWLVQLMAFVHLLFAIAVLIFALIIL